MVKQSVDRDVRAVREVGEKARDLCAPILGKKRAVQLVDAIWNLDNARWISAALEAPGRVERGKWVQQAQALVNQTRRANVA